MSDNKVIRDNNKDKSIQEERKIILAEDHNDRSHEEQNEPKNISVHESINPDLNRDNSNVVVPLKKLTAKSNKFLDKVKSMIKEKKEELIRQKTYEESIR